MTLPWKPAIPGMSGVCGCDRKPGRGDQVARRQRLAAGQRDPPDLGLFVPAGALDGGVEPHVAAHVVLVGDVVGVLLDLRARGEQPRPVRVRLEPIRVAGRGHVDGESRIVVDVPGSAQVALSVEDDEVLIAQPLELDRSTDSAEAGADDDHVELLLGHEKKVPEVSVSDEMARLLPMSLFDRAGWLVLRDCDADHIAVSPIPRFP